MTTHVSEPPGERKSIVAGERKRLARCRSHGADGDHYEKEQDDHGHAERSAAGASRLSENIDERKPCWIREGVFHTWHAEQIGDHHTKCERYVEREGPYHSFWHYCTRIFNFLGHVCNGVRS